MLLIGAAGRNAGKTEFACNLIRRFSADGPIVAAKVTTVSTRDGTCPRGGKGCGVCSSLEGEYCITRETDATTAKDTSRLLAAGASRVYWLRVMKPHLAEGLEALLDEIGRDTTIICESNSLREVVHPGLFLMVREKGQAGYKGSAASVRDRVDRTVLSDGVTFDLAEEAIRLREGTWVLREDATAVILAGGSSRRMQQDKSLLPIQGRPMIEHVCRQLRHHVADVLISANNPEKYAFLGLRVVPDEVAGEGPLMGLASALAASRHELNLAVACDIPDVDISLMHRMMAQAEGHDAVVPRLSGELLEPLFAVYRRSLVDLIREMLADGERRIRRLFDRCRTAYVDVDSADAVRNLNTMQEYQAYVGKANAVV
jgi:molybdenum cofactor guanylyltransferase